jgi:hypothetical protein
VNDPRITFEGTVVEPRAKLTTPAK